MWNAVPVFMYVLPVTVFFSMISRTMAEAKGLESGMPVIMRLMQELVGEQIPEQTSFKGSETDFCVNIPIFLLTMVSSHAPAVAGAYSDVLQK